MRRSANFYTRLGFRLLRDGGDFVENTWEGHRLFLAELSASHEVYKVKFLHAPSSPSPMSG